MPVYRSERDEDDLTAGSGDATHLSLSIVCLIKAETMSAILHYASRAVQQ